MPAARPGLVIGFMAETYPSVSISKGSHITLYDGGPPELSGPRASTTIDFANYHGIPKPMTLETLAWAISNDAPAFLASVHEDAANYDLSSWLESVTNQDPNVNPNFNMTTVFVAKNPTLPDVGNVKSGVAYGDGGSGLTGTLLVPRRSC